jgi:hypothetical protein
MLVAGRCCLPPNFFPCAAAAMAGLISEMPATAPSKSRNTGGCPSNGALITRVETTGLGNFQIRHRKAGGGKSDLITVAAVKTQNGKYVAKHVQPMTIATNTNTKYMVESGAKISPWVDVKKTCAGASAVTPGLQLGG